MFSSYPKNDSEIQIFLDAVKPCGHYANLNCPHEVIPASVTHPGSGPGELEYKAYITQFDVGLHQSLSEEMLTAADGEQINKFTGSSSEGETCLEVIVKAHNTPDDATLGGCAGKCGAGCSGAGWAKDCLKHDVCVTYKNFLF